MFVPVDEFGFFYGETSPEDETYPGSVLADGGDDGIGKVFPTERAVTARGVSIDGKNAVQEQDSRFCPVFQRGG